jgi:ribosomal-protein-alanine N-acetyltransferase
MTAGDLDEITLIEKDSFPRPWSLESFERELSLKFSSFFVAETDDGGLAGYGGLWLFTGEGHILSIAVKRDLRNKGIAKALLKRIMEFAQRRGAHTLFLEVGRKNSAARRLYESFGFNEYASRCNYYLDDDAVLMECVIGERTENVL